jgi:hypothetical protein
VRLYEQTDKDLTNPVDPTMRVTIPSEQDRLDRTPSTVISVVMDRDTMTLGQLTMLLLVIRQALSCQHIDPVTVVEGINP